MRLWGCLDDTVQGDGAGGHGKPFVSLRGQSGPRCKSPRARGSTTDRQPTNRHACTAKACGAGIQPARRLRQPRWPRRGCQGEHQELQEVEQRHQREDRAVAGRDAAHAFERGHALHARHAHEPACHPGQRHAHLEDPDCAAGCTKPENSSVAQHGGTASVRQKGLARLQQRVGLAVVRRHVDLEGVDHRVRVPPRRVGRWPWLAGALLQRFLCRLLAAMPCDVEQRPGQWPQHDGRDDRDHAKDKGGVAGLALLGTRCPEQEQGQATRPVPAGSPVGALFSPARP